MNYNWIIWILEIYLAQNYGCLIWNFSMVQMFCTAQSFSHPRHDLCYYFEGKALHFLSLDLLSGYIATQLLRSWHRGNTSVLYTVNVLMPTPLWDPTMASIHPVWNTCCIHVLGKKNCYTVCNHTTLLLGKKKWCLNHFQMQFKNFGSRVNTFFYLKAVVVANTVGK